MRTPSRLGVSGYTLMKRAGEAALRYLRTRWPMAHRIVIVCGSGNNGGDGYVLARFAHAAGLTVTVLAASSPEQLKGDARQAYADLRGSGGMVHAFAAEHLAAGEVIVDALLGTGLKGDVRGDLAPVIRAINQSGRPVFALDVPSGLDGDAGTVLGEEAIRADATVTFVGLKTGLFVGDGPEFAGTVFCDDLEISPAALRAARAAPDAHRRVRDPRGVAAPAALFQQGRFRACADRRQRCRHAGGGAACGRSVSAGRGGAHHRGGGAGERGRDLFGPS